MKVKLAKTAGFCMGVKRAFELVLKNFSERRGKICTWGPLIHNPQTVEFLREQGIDSIEDLHAIQPGSTIIIRSHGIPPETRALLENSGASICDATCPKVSRVQKLVEKYFDLGNEIVIVGNPEHAEVRGLAGYADYKCRFAQTEEEAKSLNDLRSPVVIGQTTINEDYYFSIASIIKDKFPETIILDTLCESTSRRQEEVAELAADADAIVVVGGKNSSNTKQLFEVAKKTGLPSFWVETADEILPEDFKNFSSVVLTAGASTPHWIVSRVIEKLERLGEKSVPIWEWGPLKNFGFAIVQSGLMAGLSSALLSLCVPFFAGEFIRFRIRIALAIGLFVFAMQALYNLVDWTGLALVDPSRILFFRKNRKTILFAGIGAILISIILMFFEGIVVGILMLAGSALIAITSSIKRVPNIWIFKGFSSWWEIPGAKDILQGLGWFFAVGIIPIIALNIPIQKALIILLWAFSLSLLRAALFSINELETDRILGRESLATILGERAETIIAFSAIIFSGAIIALGSRIEYFTKTSFLQIIPLFYFLALTLFRKKLGIKHGTWMELAIELGFMLMGLIAVILNFLIVL